jgi:hypothetical protein
MSTSFSSSSSGRCVASIKNVSVTRARRCASVKERMSARGAIVEVRARVHTHRLAMRRR